MRTTFHSRFCWNSQGLALAARPLAPAKGEIGRNEFYFVEAISRPVFPT